MSAYLFHSISSFLFSCTYFPFPFSFSFFFSFLFVLFASITRCVISSFSQVFSFQFYCIFLIDHVMSSNSLSLSLSRSLRYGCHASRVSLLPKYWLILSLLGLFSLSILFYSFFPSHVTFCFIYLYMRDVWIVGARCRFCVFVFFLCVCG